MSHVIDLSAALTLPSGIPVFQMRGGRALPADKDTVELFKALQSTMNDYLLAFASVFLQSARAMLTRAGITRVSVDGALKQADLVALTAILTDAAARLGADEEFVGSQPRTLQIPRDVEQMAHNARKLQGMLADLVLRVPAQPLPIPTDSPPTPAASSPTKKLSPGAKVAIGAGVGVVGLVVLSKLFGR